MANKELTEKQIGDLCTQIFNAINREVDSDRLSSIWKVEDIEENSVEYSVESDVEFLLFETTNIDNDFLTFTQIEQKGGEGDGDYAYTVIFFHDKATTKEGTYYKFEYYYSSYNGFDFDNMTVTEVTPQSKTITVYE